MTDTLAHIERVERDGSITADWIDEDSVRAEMSWPTVGFSAGRSVYGLLDVLIAPGYTYLLYGHIE